MEKYKLNDLYRYELIEYSFFKILNYYIIDMDIIVYWINPLSLMINPKMIIT